MQGFIDRLLPEKGHRVFFRDMLLLFGADFLWPLGFALYTGFLPLHVKAVGAGSFLVGLVVSIPNILGVLALVGGMLADRYDRKKLIIFGWAATIPAPLIWAFANSWQWYMVGQFMYSLTWICVPSITLYVFDYKTDANKMAGYTLVFLGNPIGSIIAPFVGGHIMDNYGKTVLYLVVFVLFSLSTLCTLFLTPQPVERRKPSGKIQLPRLNIFKRLLAPMLFIISITLIQNIGEAYLPLFLDGSRNISLKNIGLLYTFIYVGVSIFTFTFGKIRGKMPARLIINGSNLLFAVSSLFLIAGGSILSLIPAFLLRGINRSLLVFNQAVFAGSINNMENKGFILSVFIALRSLLIGLSVYPGAFLFSINTLYPFYSEILFIFVWIALSYTPLFRKYIDEPQEI